MDSKWTTSISFIHISSGAAISHISMTRGWCTRELEFWPRPVIQCHQFYAEHANPSNLSMLPGRKPKWSHLLIQLFKINFKGFWSSGGVGKCCTPSLPPTTTSKVQQTTETLSFRTTKNQAEWKSYNYRIKEEMTARLLGGQRHGTGWCHAHVGHI